MNARHRKTLAAVFARPTSATIVFADMEASDRILDRARPSEYHFSMQLATGTVVNGKVVVEGLDLPEGATVTVLTRENAPAVKLSPEEEAELLEALAEADVEEGISAEELFTRLQRFC